VISPESLSLITIYSREGLMGNAKALTDGVADMAGLVIIDPTSEAGSIG
jgi:hypothetical protein